MSINYARGATPKGLARNLDFASGLNGDAVNNEPLLYKVFPLELSAPELDAVRHALGNGMPVIVHLAEGTPPALHASSAWC